MEWTALEGFPRAVGGTRMPLGSCVRMVRGQMEEKAGRPVVLSGLKAFAQAVEQELLAAAQEGAVGAEAVLDAALDRSRSFGYTSLTTLRHHVEEIAFVRFRGSEMDLAFTVARMRGQARIHLDLQGPLGRFADDPLPELPKAKKAPKPATPMTFRPLAPAAPDAPYALPPADRPLFVRALLDGATASWGDASMAIDRHQRLWVVVRRRDASDADDHYLCVRPDGAREALFAIANGDEVHAQMGGRSRHAARLSSLARVEEAVVLRFEHYDDGASRLLERVGPMETDGPYSFGPELKAREVRVLGVSNRHLVRFCVAPDDASACFLILDPRDGAKRRRVRLAPIANAHDAALTATGDVTVVSGGRGDPWMEHRFAIDGTLRAERALTGLALDVVRYAAAVQDDAGSTLLGARGRELLRVRIDASGAFAGEDVVFSLPEEFARSEGYRSWGLSIANGWGDGQRTASFHFARDQNPGAPGSGFGALALTTDGRVAASAVLSPEGTEIIDERGARTALGAGPWTVVAATGALALTLAGPDGLALFWRGPRAER